MIIDLFFLVVYISVSLVFVFYLGMGIISLLDSSKKKDYRNPFFDDKNKPQA